jgi:hypothetical protein
MISNLQKPPHQRTTAKPKADSIGVSPILTELAYVMDTIDRVPQTSDKGIYLKQQLATGSGGAHSQPFSTRGAKDWQLPDHARGGSGGGDYYRRNLSRRPDPDHVAVRLGADRGRDSRDDADGALGDDGGRCAPARHCPQGSGVAGKGPG